MNDDDNDELSDECSLTLTHGEQKDVQYLISCMD
eukprot:CAMPEP_0114403416 /NCGR_PEP_ID=MMETSP0102-20121206/18811_1 /TAXON_ID=38822 ORGANISM="Pteridomonas danica, Strain PT" /NCGR_SAMPLE_ID=MMETSP0102 /ASSEMBLY_ACC=CAM_ASM_000212 /LENGTH=33 /DNA_ID= /DNA_START= /DNA_END= /DNA_ORIENTATION=